MRRAERFSREMMLAGASMGRRRRPPVWAGRALWGAAVGALLAACLLAFLRAVDGEAALWEVGDYGARGGGAAAGGPGSGGADDAHALGGPDVGGEGGGRTMSGLRMADGAGVFRAAVERRGRGRHG